LHSLIHHNLIKCSDEQSFNDWNLQTTFYLNKQFQPLRNGRIIHKLNIIGKLPLFTQQHHEEMNASIVALRELRIQEAIVRVLKSRKQCKLPQIQLEVVELLRNYFQPTPYLLNQQIEWLVEQEYIKYNKELEVYSYAN
ncbi:hypothetical protein SNEBB_002506, partial [Seison nebaliae]